MTYLQQDILVPHAFSEYGLAPAELPLEKSAAEGHEVVMAGLVDMELGRFFDVYCDEGGVEYRVINDNRGK